MRELWHKRVAQISNYRWAVPEVAFINILRFFHSTFQPKWGENLYHLIPAFGSNMVWNKGRIFKKGTSVKMNHLWQKYTQKCGQCLCNRRTAWKSWEGCAHIPSLIIINVDSLPPQHYRPGDEINKWLIRLHCPKFPEGKALPGKLPEVALHLQFAFPLQGDTSGCDEPPIDSKTKVPFWPDLGQNGTFILKSMGGSSQPDVSPCTTERTVI